MSKFIFLDRDGTIIKDKGYVHKIADLEFLPGAIGGLKNLKKAGYKFIIISNQAGIARDLYSMGQAEKFNAELVSRLADHEINIEKIYFCPHHPECTDPCLCRKPKPGLVKLASKEFGVNLRNIIFIGDKDCDIQLGKNCGGVTFLINNGQYKTSTKPDYEVKDLLEAAEIIQTLILKGA